jgi:peroxiredoxin
MSGDSVKAQAAFKAKQKLNFDLLSDPDLKTIEAYGARRMKKFLGRSFLGIVRSTYLICAPTSSPEFIDSDSCHSTASPLQTLR